MLVTVPGPQGEVIKVTAGSAAGQVQSARGCCRQTYTIVEAEQQWGTNSMLELKPHLLEPAHAETAYTAVMVWLFISTFGALMPGNAVTAAGPGISGVTGVRQDMLGRVLAAAALPGLFLVALTIAAAFLVATYVRRRDPVRRFTTPAAPRGDGPRRWHVRNGSRLQALLFPAGRAR
ncbi:hypothetical protein [Arthrobacter sp. BE255]|uniref:hypothetical protein n=1 Tax=Arthrobacter sp. BE255 TaxID=2817721 RepID=UPI0028597798|nr:hypothetical protein [Arthrobacter sp. BE255]MDR7161375.1 hypothetical protein [Arthrobacter sp. BE255]